MRNEINYNDINLKSVEKIKYSERIISEWDKLLSNQNNITLLNHQLEKERQSAKCDILHYRSNLSNSQLILFKLKDEFSFEDRKTLREFTKELKLPYEYYLKERPARYQGTRNVRLDYLCDDILSDTFVKNDIVKTVSEEKQNHKEETYIAESLSNNFNGQVISHIQNYSKYDGSFRKFYTNTPFTLWSIANDNINNITPKYEYLTWQNQVDTNMQFNTTTNEFEHPQDVMQKMNDEVLNSPFIKQVILKYYDLVDVVIQDELNQKGQVVEMYGGDKEHLNNYRRYELTKQETFKSS